MGCLKKINFSNLAGQARSRPTLLGPEYRANILHCLVVLFDNKYNRVDKWDQLALSPEALKYTPRFFRVPAAITFLWDLVHQHGIPMRTEPRDSAGRIRGSFCHRICRAILAGIIQQNYQTRILISASF